MKCTVKEKKAIGCRINEALALRDVKQKDLAEILGVTDNTVSYYCSGSRTPNTQQITEIAKFLNVSTDWLLGLSDAKTSKEKKCPKCHEGPFPTTYRYCPFCTADMRSEKELLIETLQRAAERLRPPYDDTASALNYALQKAILYLERE